MKYSCRIIESTHTSEPTINEPVGDLGPVLWSRCLAGSDDDLIVACGQDVTRVDASGVCLWSEPLVCSGVPRAAFISEDRLLITTSSNEYHRWGHLGPALLINLNDGSLIAELRGKTGTALRGGRFLLGLEGYDVFNTWSYDRNGTLLQEWRSYGHYIVDQDDTIRVIEQDRRGTTNARVVRLLPNGSIEKGPQLVDGTASAPLILNDGTIVFVDGGVLRAVDRKLKDQTLAILLSIPQQEIWRFTANLLLDGNLVKIEIRERSVDVPIDDTYHSWLLQLTSR